MPAKLIVLMLKLIPLAIWGWRRITLGPSANFSGMRGIKTGQIEHQGATVEVREQCTEFGWPVEAWLQFKLGRSCLFELRPQGRKWFSSELTIGVPAFDEKFFIGTESTHFAKLLAADSALRTHFFRLTPRLDRHQAKLVRVSCEGRDLAVQCNVRWVDDRPALYRDILVWMQALESEVAQSTIVGSA